MNATNRLSKITAHDRLAASLERAAQRLARLAEHLTNAAKRIRPLAR